MLNAQQVNDLKSFKLLPLINDLDYEFKLNGKQNKHKFVEEAFIKLENILSENNLPEETFKDLNVKYRKLIEEKFIHNQK